MRRCLLGFSLMSMVWWHATANEPLWTEEERAKQRDVVLCGEVLWIEKRSQIDKREDLYAAGLKVMEIQKGKELVPAGTIEVLYEASTSGRNLRCPKYAELKKGDKGKFFLRLCTEDTRKALKLDKAPARAFFLEMGSDVIREAAKRPATAGQAK